ncbi:MAG: GT4 family glycosyltransferase PelF [Acidimicrobiales bacterium]
MGETGHLASLRSDPSRNDAAPPARRAAAAAREEVDVLLTTEGTYPYVTGGVSTWAHQLLTGLADKRFVVYSVVANPNAALRYDPPSNVTHLVEVPLWGTEDAAEFNPRPGWISRRLRRPGHRFATEFLPAYEALVVSVALGDGGPDRLVDSLCALSAYADRYSLKSAMRDARTWRLFRDALGSHPLYRKLTTYEAVDLARTVYRYLGPLDYPTQLPGIVHASAAAFCSIPAVVLRERWGVPFLLTEHGVYYRERLIALGRNATNSPYRVFLSNFYAAVVAMAYSRADLVAPVARFNAAWEMRLGVDEERIHPVPNGVDPERFPIVRPAGSGAGPLTLVAVARLERLKDIHTLLRAFSVVRARRSDVRLVIHGPESDPAYARSCYALAGQLGLGGTCEFRGPTNDVGAALGEGDIAVLSSISEGFPFAAVEALMAGRPMVATEVGGVPEVVVPPYGSLVPPGRPVELADAICAMAADRAGLAEKGARARDAMLRSYTLEVFLDAHRGLYDEVRARAGHH